VAIAPTTGELRAALEQAADWCARYLERVDELPVLARVEPGEIAAALPAHPPDAGEPLTDILADVERVLLPGTTPGSWRISASPARRPASSARPSPPP
jgi:aromatic-L-amino-acid decarboxylase